MKRDQRSRWHYSFQCSVLQTHVYVNVLIYCVSQSGYNLDGEDAQNHQVWMWFWKSWLKTLTVYDLIFFPPSKLPLKPTKMIKNCTFKVFEPFTAFHSVTEHPCCWVLHIGPQSLFYVFKLLYWKSYFTFLLIIKLHQQVLDWFPCFQAAILFDNFCENQPAEIIHHSVKEVLCYVAR